jgi:hypothetical protein
MLYIIAGTRKEYEDWLSCHPDYDRRNTRYISKNEELLGIDLRQVKLVGNYKRNPIYGRSDE